MYLLFWRNSPRKSPRPMCHFEEMEVFSSAIFRVVSFAYITMFNLHCSFVWCKNTRLIVALLFDTGCPKESFSTKSTLESNDLLWKARHFFSCSFLPWKKAVKFVIFHACPDRARDRESSHGKIENIVNIIDPIRKMTVTLEKT